MSADSTEGSVLTMGGCRVLLSLRVFAFAALYLVSLYPLCDSASSNGCLARMFITAGIPRREAKRYETDLVRNSISTFDLKTTAPHILRLIGVSKLEHALAFHNCYSGLKQSPQCKAFKECRGHGQCQLSKGRRKSEAPYECNCTAGYSGSSCQKDACHKTCQNGASCKRTRRGDRFQCTCKPGYIGKRCEKTLNRCSPNPCANGGLCRPLHNDFSCTCKGGFAGKRCESHVLTAKELDKKLGVLAKAIKESGQYQLYSTCMSDLAFVGIKTSL